MTTAATADSTSPTLASPNPRSARKMLVIAVVVLAAIAVRLVFFSYQSGDYSAYFAQWYDYIKQHGGFAALKTNFANYNEPYLYLLTALTYLPVPALAGIKAMSVAFDFLLAFFAYRIVNLRYPQRWWPILAGAIVLFLPTVVLNSSMWGQADAMYSAFGIGAVYFLLRRRPWLACVFFGLAFSFKLQIVFLFPLLFLLVLRKWVPWRALLVIPVVYVLLDVPALLLGASPGAVFSLYATQTGTYDQLTLNAPNIYQYFSTTTSTVLRYGGIAVTGILLLALIIPVAVKRIPLTPLRIVLAATVSALLVPYFLPAMHERYFYLADVLTVIAAFYLPRKLWALPILEQFASFFSYLPFLLMTGGRGGFGGGGTGQRPSLPQQGTGGLPGGGFGGGGGVNSGGRGGNRGFTGGTGSGTGGTAPSGGGGAYGGAGSGNGGFTGGGGAGNGGFTGGRGYGGGGTGAGGFGGGGFPGGRGGGAGAGGGSGSAVIPFSILATVMLAALILAVWVAVREFRKLDAAKNVAGESAESSLGIGSESVKKPEAPAGSSHDQQVELDGQVWGSS
jgi:Gpi18-like mannosyltransferase